MRSNEHWEQVYSTKPSDGVSWYQEHAEPSLRLIEAAKLSPSASIIDVGGGASTLVDDLLARGSQDLTILDISQSALDIAKQRLGTQASSVRWLAANITEDELPIDAYDLWHDRAVFHFLTDPNDRRAYIQSVLRSVKPGGRIIIAVFAEDGPLRCSGLPTMQYNAAQLHAEFGEAFALVSHERNLHQTPFGTTQQFTYCAFIKSAAAPIVKRS